MKKLILFIILIVLISCNKKSSKTVGNKSNTNLPTLKIAYSPHISDSLEVKIFDLFEKEYNCKIIANKYDNADTLFSSIISSPTVAFSDIIMGFHQEYINSEIYKNFFLELDKNTISNVDSKFLTYKQTQSLPYLREPLVFVYNKDYFSIPPQTLGQLQDLKYSDSIIISDATNTNLGRSFLYWIVSIYHVGFRHFFASISKSIHMIVPSEQNSINAFIADEAPILLTYLSVFKTLQNEYKISYFIPQECYYAHLPQIGISKNTSELILSKAFINFLFSDKIQDILTSYNILNTTKKSNTEDIPELEKISDYSLKLKINEINKSKDYWIRKWKKEMKK